MENPLRAGLARTHAPEPATVVIFGASGDLTRRKLVPALYNLMLDGLLPASFALVGVARREKSDAAFAGELRAGIEKHSRRPLESRLWDEGSGRIFYVQTPFEEEEGYRRLAERLDAIDREHGTEGNRLFYLATPPSSFPVIIERLGRAGQKRMLEKFNVESMVNRYAELYRRVLGDSF